MNIMNGKRDKALKYLIQHPDRDCALLQVVRRGSADILEADGEGVLIYDNGSGAYMLSALFAPERLCWVAGLPHCSLFHLTSPEFAEPLIREYGFAHSLECATYIYDGVCPPARCGSLRIGEPSPDELERIISIYDMLSPAELRAVAAGHRLFAGYDKKGAMAGFIGMHPEGSMGMLTVLPEFRRRGYGGELERFMIGFMLHEGLVPYCHVVTGNEASEALQSKLGLRRAQELNLWLF